MKYRAGQVDRPVGNLVRIVKAGEQISEKGQEICPPFQANEEIQEAWDDEEGGALQDAPEEHPGQGDDVEAQEVQRHLPVDSSPYLPLPRICSRKPLTLAPRLRRGPGCLGSRKQCKTLAVLNREMA